MGTFAAFQHRLSLFSSFPALYGIVAGLTKIWGLNPCQIRLQHRLPYTRALALDVPFSLDSLATPRPSVSTTERLDYGCPALTLLVRRGI